MQKKFIALAIASMGAAGIASAQSNVTIYGIADVSFESVRAGGATGTGTTVASRSRVQTNSSYIGFKGAEDLGGGMKALFQFENGIVADSGYTAGATTSSAAGALTNGQTAGGTQAGTSGGANGSMFGPSRNTYVGLTGNFGTALLGYMDTPFRTMQSGFDVMPGATGVGGYNGVFGRAAGNAANLNFRTQAIAYKTPTFSGFDATIAYVPNELKSNSASAYSVTTTAGAGTYSQGGAANNNTAGTCAAGSALTSIFTGSAQAITSGFTCGAGSVTQSVANQINPQAWSLNLNYQNGPLKVAYAYLNLKDMGAGSLADEKHTANTLGASYVFGGATTVSGMWQRYTSDRTALTTGNAPTYYSLNGVVTTSTNASLTAGAVSKVKNTAWFLGLKHVMGQHELAGSYQKAGKTRTNGASADGTDANQVSLRYAYNFSKRTQAYGVYSRVSNGSATNYDFGATQQLNPTGSTAVGGGFGNGSDPKAFGVGIRHAF
jgi:predicted porin